ncbi:MAG: hypothetical protein AAGJ50_05985 [Pseudomonadota bacterium]
MTALLILLIAILGWAALLAYQWREAKALQAIVYEQRRSSGELRPHVSAEAFERVFLYCEGPRFSTYVFVSGLATLVLLPLFLLAFNAIWRFVWWNTGQFANLEAGELVHGLVSVMFVVPFLFCVAWVTMRRYHRRPPSNLRREIERLNGDTG